jgi:hypothetical protein
MSGALARLSTNETNDAANSIKSSVKNAEDKFDPAAGARGVPGRGMVSA